MTLVLFTDVVCVIYYIVDIILLTLFLKEKIELNDAGVVEICKIGDANITIFFLSYVCYSLFVMGIIRNTSINKTFSILLYIIQLTSYIICTLGFFLGCSRIVNFNFPILLIYFNIGSNIIIFMYDVGHKYKVGWVVHEERRTLL